MYVPHPRIRRLSKIPLVGTAALAALIATSVACFTATPQVAQAADAPAITDMTEQDYESISKTETKCRYITKSVDKSGFQICLTIVLFGANNLFLLRPVSLFADLVTYLAHLAIGKPCTVLTKSHLNRLNSCSLRPCSCGPPSNLPQDH